MVVLNLIFCSVVSKENRPNVFRILIEGFAKDFGAKRQIFYKINFHGGHGQLMGKTKV